MPTTVDSLEDLTDSFVICRTKRHAWSPIEDDGDRLKAPKYHTAGVQRMCFRCTRCRGKAYEAWIKRTGDLLARSYQYPDGYLFVKGSQVVVKDMRKEWLARWS